MSTDFNVVNHTRKTWWHLGQRMAAIHSFGLGSKDLEGAQFAAEVISVNLGDDLRIVSTEEVPGRYVEINWELWKRGAE